MNTIIGTEEGRLEQVKVVMPEVTAYFSGENHTDAEQICLTMEGRQLEEKSLERAFLSDEAIHYYINLDISASVSQSAFRDLVDALEGFGRTIRTDDVITLITFGDEVKTITTMTGTQIRDGEQWGELLSGLTNPDQHTLFFESLARTVGMIRQERGKAERNVILVATDGEDVATGKATKEEALEQLVNEGLPVYAFTTEETAGEYVNSLGEFTKETGGYLTLISRGSESEAFTEWRTHLLRSYKAVYTAESNVVTNGPVSIAMQNKATATNWRKTVLQEAWIEDTVAPEMSGVERCSDRQVRVQFSEPVQGTGSAAGYLLKGGEQTLVPAYASPAEDGQSVLLTFAQPVVDGAYTLEVNHITDRSMEKNALEEAATVVLTGGPEAETEAVMETELVTEAATEETDVETIVEETETNETVTGDAIEKAEASSEETTENPEETEVVPEETEGMQIGIMTDTDLTQGGSGFYGMCQNVVAKIDALSIPQKSVLGCSAVLLLVLTILLVRTVRRKKKTTRTGNAEKLQEGMKKVVLLINGRKQELQVTIRGSMIVGRAEYCDLRFSDPLMSRQHFALGMDGRKLFIRNLSENGYTTVNGNRLKGKDYILKNGDVIGAGGMKMKIAWE